MTNEEKQYLLKQLELFDKIILTQKFGSKAEVDSKVDSEEGKGLSENNFTDDYKNTLDTLDETYAKIADSGIQSDWANTDSTSSAFIKNKPTTVSSFTNDAGYVTTASPSFIGSLKVTDTITDNGEVSEGGAATFGRSNHAIGDCSFTQGSGTTAVATGSHAEGYHSIASGSASHAEGNAASAIGDFSHAEGIATSAKGNYSHAEGYWTIAKGDYSHVEGTRTSAIGSYSHSEGYGNLAAGYTAHAEGYFSTAAGDYSKTLGSGTYTTSPSGIACGKYNELENTDSYAIIVGNGNANNRNNMATLDWNGNLKLDGDISIVSSVDGEAYTISSLIERIKALENAISTSL